MSVALIEPFDRLRNHSSTGSGTTRRQAQEPLVEMTATLNLVVSINSTTVMLPYWTASFNFFSIQENYSLASFSLIIFVACPGFALP